MLWVTRGWGLIQKLGISLKGWYRKGHRFINQLSLETTESTVIHYEIHCSSVEGSNTVQQYHILYGFPQNNILFRNDASLKKPIRGGLICKNQILGGAFSREETYTRLGA